MKFISFFLVVFVLVSCQKESLVVQEETPNQNFVIDTELSGLMLSVSAHDGSFDDILDNSGCFSIKFPYTIVYNGETRIINTVNDLLGIETGQDISFQFPIEITFSDYESLLITSAEDLRRASASCSSNQTFLNSISCVDFMYPIRIATYNSDTNRFNTIVIDHDQQNFRTVNDILENQLAEIRFPLSLQLANNELLQIETSQELKDIIYLNAQNCE